MVAQVAGSFLAISAFPRYSSPNTGSTCNYPGIGFPGTVSVPVLLGCLLVSLDGR